MSMQVIAPYGENELFPIPRKCFNKIAVRRITLSEVMLEISKPMKIYSYGSDPATILVTIYADNYSFLQFQRAIEKGHAVGVAAKTVSVKISGDKVYLDANQPIRLDKDLADLFGIQMVITKPTPIKWGFSLVNIFCELIESYRDGKPSHFLTSIRHKIEGETIYEPANPFFLEIDDSTKISNFKIWSEPKISGLEVTLEFSP